MKLITLIEMYLLFIESTVSKPYTDVSFITCCSTLYCLLHKFILVYLKTLCPVVFHFLTSDFKPLISEISNNIPIYRVEIAQCCLLLGERRSLLNSESGGYWAERVDLVEDVCLQLCKEGNYVLSI